MISHFTELAMAFPYAVVIICCAAGLYFKEKNFFFFSIPFFVPVILSILLCFAPSEEPVHKTSSEVGASHDCTLTLYQTGKSR